MTGTLVTQSWDCWLPPRPTPLKVLLLVEHKIRYHLFLKDHQDGYKGPIEIRNGWVLVDTKVHTYAEITEEAFGQFLVETANPVLRPELEHDAEAYHAHEKRKSVRG